MSHLFPKEFTSPIRNADGDDCPDRFCHHDEVTIRRLHGLHGGSFGFFRYKNCICYRLSLFSVWIIWIVNNLLWPNLYILFKVFMKHDVILKYIFNYHNCYSFGSDTIHRAKYYANFYLSSAHKLCRILFLVSYQKDRLEINRNIS